MNRHCDNSKYTVSLMLMVENLLSGLWSVCEFRENYYYYYLDEVPDDMLSDAEVEFFGGLQEKLDWVDESPDDESQNVGWLDNQQFLKWAIEHKTKITNEH